MGNKSKRQSLQRRQPSTVMTHSVKAYSGPLPSPDMLEKYNAAFEECAERIVAMTEKQALHRQELERDAQRANIAAIQKRQELEKVIVQTGVKNEARGQIFGFIIALSAIVGGTVVIAIGKDVIGLIAIISALASLAGVFIYGKRRQGRELTEKNLGETRATTQ